MKLLQSFRRSQKCSKYVRYFIEKLRSGLNGLEYELKGSSMTYLFTEFDTAIYVI